MALKHFTSPPQASMEDTLKFANEQLENARGTKNPAMKLQFCNNAKSMIEDAEKSFATERAGSLALDDSIATAYHEHAKLLEDLGSHDKAQKSHCKAKDWGYALKEIPGIENDQPKANVEIARLPQQIFPRNVVPHVARYTLPEDSSHITSTAQLAYCLSLSLPSLIPKEKLNEDDYRWSQAKVGDPDELERLQTLATSVIRAFIREVPKKPDVVAEVVCLAAVLDQADFRNLLQVIVDDIENSVLLKVHLLDGLAHLIGNAAPGSIDTGDLVRVLELFNARLKGTHQEATEHICRLLQVLSRVLDSMVDCQVKDLKKEHLHEPLLLYLKDLRTNSDPYLAYQAAYAYQALQYIPDDETILQTVARRTEKVIQGISGVVSAVEALDLPGFIDGLKGIQGGLNGAVDTTVLINEAYIDAKHLAESGQNLLESLTEGTRLHRRSASYPALRGLDLLFREGQFADAEKLIQEAPCLQDSLFQWGVCQRLWDLTSNPFWDVNIRQCAISLLRELYNDDVKWGLQTNVKQWILCLFTKLTDSSEALISDHARECLLELEIDGDTRNQLSLQSVPKELLGTNSLIAILPPRESPLLDRVLNKPDVEAALRRLRGARLGDRYGGVYISPRAKANLSAAQDFDLTPKVQEFLKSTKKVLLLLGDSGSGKSTFNKVLETSLWDNYGTLDKRIPLFVHLPTIDKPEYDLIAKQLHKVDFTEKEIIELKLHHEFILICDGYDESQQTRNLYSSNQLNQVGGWRAQMVISCRTEYTGVDYRDCFQPNNRNGRGIPELFQEVVITPFNETQVQDYIKQYVTSRKPSWKLKDYKRALKDIPNLQGLVKNPFLLKLTLEVLPQLVNKESDLSTACITRIGLYDSFVAQWLERGKIRLIGMELNSRDTEAFNRLLRFGFNQQGIKFLTEFSTAIYDHQGGNPVVSYSDLRDRATWKREFFSKEDGKNFLLGSMPLICSGTQYRFVHRSVLEYGLALAIFDPALFENNTESTPAPSRRGSTSSILSFEAPLPGEKPQRNIDQSLWSSPLGRRNFIGESTILQFLVDRAQQNPVFKEQLHATIQLSKTEKDARVAAANAITVLVKAGFQFNGEDLRGIKIPGADVSYGVFDSAMFEGADLRKANLHNAWLRKANLSGAQMSGVQFGELPYLQEESAVRTCAYSPDGKTYAAGLMSGDISLYDTSSWSRVQTLRGHRKNIASLVYSPKGDKIATGSWDKTVRLWDVETGDCVHALKEHSGSVWSVAYSPKGDQIASGSWDNTVKLWDVETGECIHTLQGHSYYVRSVVYSPKGDRIASGSEDKTVRLWEVETGNCIYTLQGHDDHVFGIIYSPNGDQIVSGSDDSTMILWDVETGKCAHTLQGHGGSVISVVYSPKGDQIASGSKDKTVRLWDVKTGNCIHILRGHGYFVYTAVYSPKGDQIASGSGDLTVRLWDVETGSCLRTLQGHKDLVRSIAYSPNGDHIASGSRDKTVRLWKVEARNFVHTLQRHSDFVWSIAYSPNGDQVASGSKDKTVRLWDIETGNCVHTLRGHSELVMSVVYSPKGNQVASGSWDNTVRLWDVETGNCVHILRGHKDYAYTVMYSPKGDQVASGSWDNTVRLWNVETGKRIYLLRGHSNYVRSVSYSPKGDQIASGSEDGTARLWDAETGNCIHTLQGHSASVDSAVYSPDGLQIATASGDKTARLWSVETGDCIHTLQGHSDYVLSAVYSPDGGYIASGSRDNTVRLWEVDTGTCIHTLQGHSDYIWSIVYSPKGDQIASGSRDKTTRLWSIKNGQCLAVITGFDGGIGSIVWENTFNGQYLVTGCWDRSVRRWRIVNEQDEYKAQLCWSSSPGVLTVRDASFNGVQGLSATDWMLLHQRGISISSPVLPELENCS